VYGLGFVVLVENINVNQLKVGLLLPAPRHYQQLPHFITPMLSLLSPLKKRKRTHYGKKFVLKSLF